VVVGCVPEFPVDLHAGWSGTARLWCAIRICRGNGRKFRRGRKSGILSELLQHEIDHLDGDSGHRSYYGYADDVYAKKNLRRDIERGSPYAVAATKG